MTNNSLKIRYVIWGALLVISLLIFNAGTMKINSITGISIPIEVLPIILSVFLLASSYLLSLKNKYFRSVLWVLTILSTSSVVYFFCLLLFGSLFGAVATAGLFIVALFAHYYFFWSK